AGIISKFTGAALYAKYAVSDAVVLGVRGESFSTENTGYIGYGLTSGLEAEKVNSLTFSANIGSGSLKFIPEIRFDSASDDVFLNSDIAPSKSAAQGVLAAVFSF
ncbi:MAG: porin, partial [Cyclobacteriaceae bacterium]|nr:porin [Cyclobacteriaceae bacterium]